MHTPDDRAAELIAAAVADELTPEEAEEFEALRREQPWVDEEVASLRALVGGLDGVGWTAAEPDESLRARIAAISDGVEPPAPIAIGRPRSRRWIVPVLGAACLAVGLAIGVALPSFDTTPVGPPGTLGAVENVEVQDEPGGTVIDADLVAHTWGTEAILDATGLEVGAAYAVVLVASDGTEFSAGAMRGSAMPIHCRVNAAVLREDAVRLEIRDAGSRVVAAADLPEV